ncbi:MAG: glutamate-5-semialdehyde dehydrogenase [Lachnospiraceae bacterium]|nr:glutamate-5-semialdehyde dehydrogenase [Lachnospiraceae bacterium]
MSTQTMKEITKQMKADSFRMAALSEESRNRILGCVKEALNKNRDAIFAANRKDMENAEENNIPVPVKKRLLFDEHKLSDVTAGIEQLIALPDPIDKVVLERELDKGLLLKRVTCPIGVIGIIFESRPDALIQISTLCIKSGNCAILKGGSETANTNRVLFETIYEAALSAGAPKGALYQAQAHSEIDELLDCYGSVDLIIPRGSNAFVQYIMNHTRIPVMGHADGICHTYVDKDADLSMAEKIIVDAKIQYTAACNATETLLVDRSIADHALPVLARALSDHHVLLRGTKEVSDLLKNAETAEQKTDCVEMEEDDFAKEYLDLIISVKLVDGVDEAITHINRFGSHHTDAIITQNPETAEKFLHLVDSAGCYVNCSTRFSDGFRYGFGAEVGISTSKLHARGPVGLEGLTTYKYKLYGNGQTVGEYADGTKQFHFRDI